MISFLVEDECNDVFICLKSPGRIYIDRFRIPLISYIYERGWRQGFSALGGWPGPEKEVIHNLLFHDSVIIVFPKEHEKQRLF